MSNFSATHVNVQQSLFARAWSELPVESPVVLPWDKGCWKCIVGGSKPFTSKPFAYKRPFPPAVFDSPDVEPPADSAKKLKPQPQVVTSWKQIVKTSSDESWVELRDAQFQIALRRWLDVVLHLPDTCAIVQQLKQLESVSKQLRMMRDIFFKKAPQTLLKRCHSFLRFVSYLEEIKEPFPGTEAVLYQFICKLRESGATTSNIQSIVQSLNFAQHVIGLPELMQLTISRRCVGAVGVRNTGPKRQAHPIRLDEMLSLHAALHDHSLDLWTRVFVGAVLCAVYTRSRWSDLQHAECLLLDCDDHGTPVYIEFRISSHKCRESTAFRNTFLTAVAPSLGVSDEPWVPAWMEIRKELGIDLDLGHPTMPAPDSDGRATKRPLGTDEMKHWLHLVLKNKGHSLENRRLTSHSCKCTVLSWLSKRGDDWTDRMALGGHVSFMKSVVVYSRDAVSRPLRILDSLLRDIRLGQFAPDETRSGRFRNVAPSVVPSASAPDDCEAEGLGWTLLSSYKGSSMQSGADSNSGIIEINDSEAPDVKNEEPQSSSTDSDALTTSSSEDEAGAEKTGASRPMRLPTVPEPLKLIQHVKYKTLHLMEKQNFRVMLCGRMLIEGRYAVAEAARFDTPCCHTCWRHKGEYEP